MASTKPQVPTMERIAHGFVGTTASSTRKNVIFNDLHVFEGPEGLTWMSNALWMARPAYHPALQSLIKKFPELASHGRWKLDRAAKSWSVERIGEASTEVPGYLRSALERSGEVKNGVALRQKVEFLGQYPYRVELTSQSGRTVWPLESADIHRSQYGFVNGLYAGWLQSSAEPNYFQTNHKDGEYVLNQGWTTPFELGSSGIHVFAHWHTLNVTASSTAHGVKSGACRIIDSFLVEHCRDRLPS